ncbi:MAG TPA: metabolite traffic protein EboE [Phycisphaerae bacterium]|nr:metabolite traffic protein EboE [Phycisphaerae bacterium]
MKIQDHPPVHLTYCLNVHPGEAWEDVFAAVRDKATAVRQAVYPAGDSPRPFGLGLRLGAQAAEVLANADELRHFAAFLRDRSLYAFTINGFPYGRFHGAAVKEQAYSPDWRARDRRDYTIALADILAELLPEGVPGSISTVPGSYKPWIRAERDVEEMVGGLADVALHLAQLAKRTGRDICLALEPEPDCFAETVGETVELLSETLMRLGCRHLRSAHGLSSAECERVLRERVGVCLDTAHAAVEFEDPAEALARYAAAGVRVAKVQVSSAIEARATDEALSRLESFRDAVYLHQVKVRRPDGTILSLPDLDAALADPRARQPDNVWRVHFHVPMDWRGDGALSPTAGLLTGAFAEALRGGACPHVEIETYTMDVLPEELRPSDVVEAVAREYRWVLRNLFAASPS